MQKHPSIPGIWLHTDDELARALGSRIMERKTIHEWPLSCVQRLQLSDGRKLVYKSQLPPTVEAEFYEKASSDLLPGHGLLEKLGDCTAMTIEWIDAPLLRDVLHNEYELIEHGRKLISQISSIGGNPPAYLNIGSASAWSKATDIIFKKLAELVQKKRFPSILPRDVPRLEQWSKSQAVLDAIAKSPGLTHGDLKADQVFVAPGGYRVIDWQRPVVAPPEVDLVCLIVEQGMNPRRHVEAIFVSLFWFLRLHWAVEAQFDLFSDAQWPLFDQWASRAIREIFNERQ